MKQGDTVFYGELQLTAWGESSTAGSWVKFWCHPEDLEQFKKFQLRKGTTCGTRLATAMAEIGPDEALVPQGKTDTDTPASTPAAPAPATAPGAASKPPRSYKPHIGALGMLAVRWCKDPLFKQWAFDQDGYNAMEPTEDGAKEYILMRCGLYHKHGAAASRKHLDTDPEAAALFQTLIRHPFMDYQEQHR